MGFDHNGCLDLFLILKKEEIILAEVTWQNKIYLNYTAYLWKYVCISAGFDHLYYLALQTFASMYKY